MEIRAEHGWSKSSYSGNGGANCVEIGRGPSGTNEDMTAITEGMLAGFFVGWPKAPSVQQHLAVLRGSYRSIVAIDDATGRAVGFVNMISDGVLTAFIPWLEVLPEYQGQGIGTALMQQVLESGSLYSVDLVCDEPLLPYYAKLGMTAIPGAGLRNGPALHGPSA